MSEQHDPQQPATPEHPEQEAVPPGQPPRTPETAPTREPAPGGPVAGGPATGEPTDPPSSRWRRAYVATSRTAGRRWVQVAAALLLGVVIGGGVVAVAGDVDGQRDGRTVTGMGNHRHGHSNQEGPGQRLHHRSGPGGQNDGSNHGDG